MKAVAQLAVITVLSIAAAGATWWIKGPPTRLLHCDPATLKEDEVCLESIPPDAEVVWVDARSRADWEKNGVPGSLLWNLDPTEDMQAFEATIAAGILMSPRVIVYCGDENCGVSRQVAERIRALDLGAKISVLHGGWRALSEAGRVKGSSPKP
jgi:rhodanese-related sulfurtransferase